MNDLDAIFDQCWDLLAQGVARRKSPAHAPVVATIGRSGVPSQRVLVLRMANRDSRLLRFHTDFRSDKVQDIEAQPSVSVLVYDPEAAVQLRLSGTGAIEGQGDTAEAAWASSTLFARRCYMAESGPGTVIDAPASGLPDWIEGKMPTNEQIAPARPNFAVLLVTLTSIEWLNLANTGHRRARFEFRDDRWTGAWLIP